MFLEKREVEIPAGYMCLVHYCRDCFSQNIETIQTCKDCGSHNVASPYSHTLDDYKDGIGTKQETKKETLYIYKCDLCGKEFDGQKTDAFLSYSNGEFEKCDYSKFADAEYEEFINYKLEKDLCPECKNRLQTHLQLKLIDFTRNENIQKLIKEYIDRKRDTSSDK